MMFTGLNNQIHGSQLVFRAVLKAMSEPTTITTVDDVTTWGDLNAASVGVLLSLCDQNTHVFFAPSLTNDTINKSTQFHTQAILSDSPSSQFAFIKSDDFQASNFNHGDETYPERSATVVIQVDSLTAGAALVFSGAGIETTKTASPVISYTLLNYYKNQVNAYPLGIDTILTCGDQLMAIPRSTKVQEAN